MINASDLVTIQILLQSSSEQEIHQAEVWTILWRVFLAAVNSSMWTVNCYCQRNIISLHLCNEYLTVMKFKTSALTRNEVVNVLICGSLHASMMSSRLKKR